MLGIAQRRLHVRNTATGTIFPIYFRTYRPFVFFREQDMCLSRISHNGNSCLHAGIDLARFAE